MGEEIVMVKSIVSCRKDNILLSFGGYGLNYITLVKEMVGSRIDILEIQI